MNGQAYCGFQIVKGAFRKHVNEYNTLDWYDWFTKILVLIPFFTSKAHWISPFY